MVETHSTQTPAQFQISGIADYWDDRNSDEAMLNIHG